MTDTRDKHGENLEIIFREFVDALKQSNAAQATTIAEGVSQNVQNDNDEALAAHARANSGVHGVGAGYIVAKTANPTGFPRWVEIDGRPAWIEDQINPSTIEIDASQVTTGVLDIARLPVADPGEISDMELVRADDPRLGVVPQMMRAQEGMGAGSYVCVVDDGGTAKIRRATAADTTHAAVAFIGDSIGANEDTPVYFDGINTQAYFVIGTSLTPADVGRVVFLAASMPGALTLVPPSTTGQLLQPVGRIVRVITETIAAVLTAFETEFYL